MDWRKPRANTILFKRVILNMYICPGVIAVIFYLLSDSRDILGTFGISD